MHPTAGVTIGGAGAPSAFGGPPAATRPMIGSTFSRSSRNLRRMSHAELWSIDHVGAPDKWIAQQVRCLVGSASYLMIVLLLAFRMH